MDTRVTMVRAVVLAAAGGACLAGLWTTPAQAATGQGCTGSVSSVTDQGTPLDSVTVPGPDGTPATPFQLYWGAPVTWTGQSAEPVTSGSWRLAVRSPSWLFALGELVSGHPHGITGTFDDGLGGTSFTDTFTPSSIETLTLPGRFDVGLTVTGPGNVQCAATLSVRVLDSPGRNPLWWLASLLIVIGLILLFVCGLSKWTKPAYVRSNDSQVIR